MYIDTLSYQLRVFAYSCGFGFFLGGVYDILRIIRLTFSQKKKRVFIWDVIYGIIASFLCVIFSFAVCRGEFSFPLYFGIPAGFFTYYFALGNIVLKFSNRVIRRLRRIIIFIKKPVERLFGLIIKKTAIKGKKIKNKSKYHLQVDKVMLYNTKR